MECAFLFSVFPEASVSAWMAADPIGECRAAPPAFLVVNGNASEIGAQ